MNSKNMQIAIVSLFITWLILRTFSFSMIGAPAAVVIVVPFYVISFIVIYAFVYATLFHFGRYLFKDEKRDTVANPDKQKKGEDNLITTASKSFKLAGDMITKALIGIGVIIVLLILLFKYDASKRVQESFRKSYLVRNYHDANITYYEKILATYSQKFVEGHDKREIFEAYVKKSIASKCIKHFLENHLESKKAYRMQGNFDRFYRNKYAVNQELIDNTIENMDFIDDANAIAYIDSSVGHSIYHDSISECQNLTDVEVLYPSFKEQYLYRIQAKIKSTKEGKNYKFNYLLKSKADDYQEFLEAIGG